MRERPIKSRTGRLQLVRKGAASELMATLDGRFSRELDIDLASLGPGELFKWLLAAVLFGAPIPHEIATRTYLEFCREKLISPRAILRRGWDGLVETLDNGGYVRYDFKTASKLLDLSNALIERYKGDLNRLHDSARDPQGLQQRLQALAKGIGEVTAGIFLRELRGLWSKAQPRPSELAIDAARHLRFIPRRPIEAGDALRLLQNVWTAEGNRMKDFSDFETALVRQGMQLRRRIGRRKSIRRYQTRHR
jgi:hypothetical protein